jgi:hypothetical protein
MDALQAINVINSALQMLRSKDVTFTSDHAEALTDLKFILRAVLSGELVLVTPNRVLPEGVQAPNKVDEIPTKIED